MLKQHLTKGIQSEIQRKPSGAMFANLRGGDGYEAFGYPLFLSFDSSWSCSRVRYLIWQQVCRRILC
jgi:hypothetical protein